MLTKRTAQLEKELQEEREAKNRAVEETAKILMHEINMLQTAADAEKVARLEQAAAITRKATDDVSRLTERQDSERVSVERENPKSRLLGFFSLTGLKLPFC